LVLFYREEQSIERVAGILEVSEEAVRQRLSRGRKLLHERVIMFVEGALQRSAPGQVFTISVVSALPPFTVATGSPVAGKVGLKLGLFAILKGLLLKFMPAVAGVWMMLKMPNSQREREFTRKAFAILIVGAFLFPAAVGLAMHAGGNYWDAHPQRQTLVLLGSAFGFVAVIGPYTFWMSREQGRIRKEEMEASVDPDFLSLNQPYEYRSGWTLLGLPLIHVRFNHASEGNRLPAKGWIAVGEKAYGILFAFGGVAVGCTSCGGLAVGVFALGGFGIGCMAFGGLSLGLAAMGGAAAGYIAYGGGAIGWLGAGGGAAVARHFALGGGAIAEHANDLAARVFMHDNFFFRNELNIFAALIWISWLVPPAASLYFKRRMPRISKMPRLPE
jgi:hypothetical protein